MKRILIAALFVVSLTAQDKLGRDNPRSTVTNFLQACRRQDYDTAAQYVDLHYLPEQDRHSKGPAAARKIEAALNAAPQFTVFALTQNPEGTREYVAGLTQNRHTYSIDLERVPLPPNGPPVWLFAPDTALALLSLNLSASAPWLVHYLPPFLVSVVFLETPLWKWLFLIVAAFVLFSVSRLLDWLLSAILRMTIRRVATHGQLDWTDALNPPVRVIVLLLVFRLAIEIVNPTAVARLYIGRTMELLIVWSIARCLVRIVDLLLNRVETDMATRQQFSGRSVLRLGRRTASFTIIVIAILMILASWGYNTATVVAGLGVGGIAVALAAQQTLANIFGGISIIADRPVVIGDYGKFGDVTGTVEDIGMRSTQVRTLNRTVVSIPNSNFAGVNLENYSKRDKILFNPTFQIKRTTPDDQVLHLIDSVRDALKQNQSVELVPTPVRLTGVTSAALNIEVFCYVLTPDVDQFFKLQGELLLAINRALQAAHIELV